MSSVIAITEDMKIEARIASFYEINGDVRMEIARELSDKLVEIGKKHNFLVWRVQVLSDS
jgi:hypothetical protein